MGRTTDEWAELLNGTAEGPWEAERHGNEEVLSICTTVHDPKRFVGDFYGERNARLAAAAPDAVAEVIRLRREVAAFRDKLTKSAERNKAIYDRDRDLDHLLDAEFDWEIASILNRILDGDTYD